MSRNSLSALRRLIPELRKTVQTPASQLHSSASTKAVKSISGALPDAWIAHQQEKAERTSNIIMFPQELSEKSKEFLDFMQKNPSVESQSMLDIIRQFQAQEKDVAIIENLMPPSVVDEDRLRYTTNVVTDSYGISSISLKKIVQEQKGNIDLIQILYQLFGYRLLGSKFFDPKTNKITQLSPFTVLRSTSDQPYHKDGSISEMTENDKIKYYSIIGANALFATKSDDASPVITSFIAIQDVVKKLNREDIEILKQPLFSRLSVENYEVTTKDLHPILLELQDGTFEAVYPALAEAVPFFTDNQKLEKAVAALNKFKDATKEVEQENALQVILTAEQRRPNNMVLFINDYQAQNNGARSNTAEGRGVLHRRKSDTPLSTKLQKIPEGENPRETISVIAAQVATKTPPAAAKTPTESPSLSSAIQWLRKVTSFKTK